MVMYIHIVYEMMWYYNFVIYLFIYTYSKIYKYKLNYAYIIIPIQLYYNINNCTFNAATS